MTKRMWQVSLAALGAGMLAVAGCRGPAASIGGPGASGTLTSSGGSRITGSVTGPAGIIANNSAGVIANNSAGVIANNSAGVIANNSAGVIANNSAGYRIAAASAPDVPIANALVYLTTPDERLYADKNGHVISAMTDAKGNYAFPNAPSTSSLIVTVVLANNRRLVGYTTTTTGGATGSYTVNVNEASTLVTEYLRKKARDASSATLAATMASYDTTPTLSNIANLTNLTQALQQSGGLTIDPNVDLQINNIPNLLAKYVVAMCAAPVPSDPNQDLTTAWKNVVHVRPVAIATLPGATQPAGRTVLNLAVGPSSLFYVGQGTSYQQIFNWDEVSAPNAIVSGYRNTTFTRTGPLLGYTHAIAVGASGALYWWDFATFTATASAPSGFVSGLFRWDPTTHATAALNVGFDQWTSTGLGGTPSASGGYPQIFSMCFDSSGAMYFDDNWTNTVYRLTASQLTAAIGGQAVTATTFAGFPDGSNTHPIGDGSPASASTAVYAPGNANLNTPEGVTFFHAPYDAAGTIGSLYISDGGNHLIRRVPVLNSGIGGNISTVAGSGPVATNGNPGSYVAADDASFVDGSGGVAPTAAHLNFPRQVQFDARGNMFIPDHDNNRIRMVTFDANGNPSKIFTVAGEPTNTANPFYGDAGEATQMTLGNPEGLAVDRDGNLVFCDGQKIRKLYIAHGVL